MVTPKILWKKRKQTSLCCVAGESQNRLTAANTGFEQSVKPLTLKAPNVCPLFMLTPSSSFSSTSPSSSCFSACLASASTVRLEFRVACPTIVPLFTASLCTFIAGFDSQLWPFRQRVVFPFRRRTMMLLCSKYHRKLHVSYLRYEMHHAAWLVLLSLQLFKKAVNQYLGRVWIMNFLMLRTYTNFYWSRWARTETAEKWIKCRVADGFA